MDRYTGYRYKPFCPRRIAQVDQYLWPANDSRLAYRTCHNGLSHPVYDCRGYIHYSLPLHQYPPDAMKVHPDIIQMKREGWN